jgi:hypothetical protein
LFTLAKSNHNHLYKEPTLDYVVIFLATLCYFEANDTLLTDFISFQVVDVPTIDNRECEGWHRDKGIRVIIYDEMMCAGYYDGGKDSCQVRLSWFVG